MTDDITPETAATPTPTAAGPAPTGPTPTDPAPTAPAAAPAPDPTPDRAHPAQFGTIVWGILLLALCGYVALAQFGPGLDADRYLWAFVGVIAAGVALVAVGIVAAFRR